MLKRGLLGLLLLGVTLGVIGWLRWDRDMWQIKRRSEELALTLHRTPDEGLLPLAQRVLAITAFFAHTPTIIAGEPLPIISSREDLISVASAALQVTKRLDTRIVKRDVEWLRPHIKAVMHVTVDMTAESLNERRTQLRRYEATWIREDKQWVIATAKPSEDATHPSL